MPALRLVDARRMGISAVNPAMYGIAAAQAMFGGAAQAAAGVATPAGGDGSATEAVQVAVLQKALDVERGLVNILA